MLFLNEGVLVSLGDGGLYIPLRWSLLRGVGVRGAGFKVESFKLRMIVVSGSGG